MTTTTEKYRPIAKLGAGGMASVELAVMNGTGGINKLLVVKKLLAHLAPDPSYVAMFVNEARVAARLSHPNIVSTYEVGSDGEVPFIVMEYLEGQALSTLFRRLGRPNVSLPHQLHVLRGILAGLDYAHKLVDFDGSPLGLVHRDVSPQNAFICYDGRIKLVDFGIAKLKGLDTEAKPGVLKGKIAYMAPEQLRGKEVDGRADLYSVGIMLWETLAGRRMTLGEAEAAVVEKRKRGEIPDLAPFNPHAPAPLLEVCARALALSPDERFPSAEAMLIALDDALRSTGTQAVEQELGAFVAEAFIAERAGIQAIIETQLKSFTLAAAGPAVLPELERRELSPSEAVVTDEGRTGATPSSGPASLSRTASLKGEVDPPPSAPREAPPLGLIRRNAVLIGSSFLFVIVAASGGWLATSGAHRASPPDATGPSALSSGRSRAQAPAHVTLNLRATPPQAVFLLDGRQLPGNPTTVQVLKDTLGHRLNVQAGRVKVERTLLYDHDQTVDLALPNELNSAGAPSPAKNDLAHPGHSRDDEGASPPAARNARPHRALDEQNPY